VPCARHHARRLLWEWHLSQLADPVELVISELITNAVAASRLTGTALAVRLWLLSDTTRVLVLVGDGSSQAPERAEPAADVESGRGLLLVEAVSSRWGWRHDQHGGSGKVVWAEVGEQGALGM
jgi:Histidine kinase-like ATPase domain